MCPFHDFKTLNNCHLLLSGIDKSNQNDQSMTKCIRLMIQTHACRVAQDAHNAGHLCMFTVIWAPAQWDSNNICHWGLVNGLLQFRDSWWTQMASCETLMRARPVTEGLMASLLESSSLRCPPLPRHLKSQSIPSATHKPRASPLITNTSRGKRLCTLTPSQTHRAAWNRPRWYSTQEHGSKLNLHIRLIVCCHWQPFVNWPLNTTYMSSSFERNRPLWTMHCRLPM